MYSDVEIMQMYIQRNSNLQPASDCLSTGRYPLEWKKGDVVPVYLKGDKQQLIDKFLCCRYVGNILKSLYLEKCSDFYWQRSNIIKAVFKPGDSCMNQLPSEAHEICKFLDNAWKFEVCSYISQKLLIMYNIKVTTNGISGILTNFL